MTETRGYVRELMEASKGVSRFELDKRIRWAFPQLYLSVRAGVAGVTVYAVVSTTDDRGRLRTEDIARVTWAPEHVTEALVVQWAHRALEVWLAKHVR